MDAANLGFKVGRIALCWVAVPAAHIAVVFETGV
jgi:hypothetical protein